MTEEPTDGWHQPLRHIRADELTGDTGQTRGMARREAVSAKTVGSRRVWRARRTSPRGASSGDHQSGDHHHGDSGTAIHVLRGHPVFVFAEDGEEVRLATGPGTTSSSRRTPRIARRTRPTRRPWWSSPAAARRRSWSTCPG
jgi:uncharacterized RmlC-like cupin family protein